MSPAAAVDAVEAEHVEVTIRMPRSMLDELRSYDADAAWTIRRALAHLVEEEDRQAAGLAVLSRRAPGRPRRAA